MMVLMLLMAKAEWNFVAAVGGTDWV